MSTYDEHYEAAEKGLADARDAINEAATSGLLGGVTAALLAEAQVHATLALAEATRACKPPRYELVPSRRSNWDAVR